MKKTIISLSLLFSIIISGFSLANKEITTESQYKLYVTNLYEVKDSINRFIKDIDLNPNFYNISKGYIKAYFELDQDQYNQLKNQIPNWGYVSYENSDVTNIQDNIENIDFYIQQLEEEKIMYEELKKTFNSTYNEKYYYYCEKVISLEKDIASQKRTRKEYLQKVMRYKCTIEIFEETNSTLEYTSSWVNMPGIEYSFLFTERPVNGFTPSRMQGVNLKYMFNTGKTYCLFGLYRSLDAKNENEFDEMYQFAIGQDLYSKLMGRGQRNFFNPYTSFNLGISYATGEKSRLPSLFLNPFIGVEIYKNRYILLDNKIGYFLPFKENRNTRGLLYNVSFNFVF